MGKKRGLGFPEEVLMSTPTMLPFAPESNVSARTFERYRQGYEVARSVADFAEKVRLGGMIVAGVCVVAASVVGQLAWHSGSLIGSMLLLACAVVAVLAGRIWEKVFQAQGHLLEMSVDSAVNSSPFLSNTQRATAIGLRPEGGSVTSIEAKMA